MFRYNKVKYILIVLLSLILLFIIFNFENICNYITKIMEL